MFKIKKFTMAKSSFFPIKRDLKKASSTNLQVVFNALVKSETGLEQGLLLQKKL